MVIGDVVQFTENHKWCGSNDDKAQTAYIFDDGSNIERIGEAVMVVGDAEN